MTYDLLIRNGRIVDGSGMPAFRGDVAVKDGKIVEIGKLGGAASRVVDAEGVVVAPGFIDNHCHYDAQVTWDPLCSFSCDHGATTVIFGNCSLSLAPVRPGRSERLAEFLSYVEAIPMEVLRTVEFQLGDDAAIHRPARPQSRGQCRQLDRSHCCSLLRNGRRMPEARPRPMTRSRRCRMSCVTACAPALLAFQFLATRVITIRKACTSRRLWADEKEIFALCDVLRELGTGIIQSGGGNGAEMKEQLDEPAVRSHRPPCRLQ